jgi:glutamate/aspartate transport system permease protein
MGSYNWNWPILLKEPYFGWIVSGFGNTILIAALAWVIAFPWARRSGLRARRTIACARRRYHLRRDLPQHPSAGADVPLVFRRARAAAGGLGALGQARYAPPAVPHRRDVPRALHSSRVAEQVRSGIESIPRGQRNAGLAMGLTQLQVYRYVLIPVAYRTIIPPLTSDFLGVFKNSSLALTIGVLELTSQARQIEEYTFAAFEAFTVATVLYCTVTGIVIVVMRIIEQRTRIAGTIAVGAQ